MILASTAGEVITWIVWVIAAFALLASGFAVVRLSNPFYCALALILNLGSLAVLYLLLSAEFVAAAQVLVYAGAVMVLFLFVIAYLGVRADAPWAGGRKAMKIAASVAGLAILVEMLVAIGLASSDRLSSPAEIDGAFGSPAEIGRLFLSDHLLAFEVTSIILLVAAVGGVVLAAAARNAQTEGSDPAEAVEG